MKRRRAVRFVKVSDGEWVQPIMRGYRMKCCDCGLIHRLNFRIVSNGKRTRVQFQAFRETKPK